MKYVPGYLDSFISPITGDLSTNTIIPLSYNYILIGDRTAHAVEGPQLIDVWLDIRNIREKLSSTHFILQTASPDFINSQALDQLSNNILSNLNGVIVNAILPEKNLWLGDASNTPQPFPTIQIGNLPNLTQNYFWIGDSTNRPVETNLFPIGSLPDLAYHNIWIGDATNRPLATQRIDNLNLPQFLTADPTSNFGIYNLYTGGTINTAHPIDDPGPVATTTLRVDMSNLPNLGKGKIWMGVSNPIPPVITIDAIPPYFHVTGSLNWDVRGALLNSYAVPTETGLSPGTIFIGDFDNPGQIIIAGLTAGYMFIGNDFGQIVETTLNPGNIFIGSTVSGKIIQTGLDPGHIFIGNDSSEIIQTGLNEGWVFIGNDLGQVVQTGLTWGNIFIGDSLNKVTQQGLFANALWTGASDDSGRMVSTIALQVVNLPALAFNYLWLGDDIDRPVPTQALNIVNLPDLILNNFWLGNGSDRPTAVPFNIETGTGLEGGPINNGSGTISIADTGVTAGSYTSANLTVNAQGQITTVSNGSGGTVTEVDTGTGLIGGPITSTGTISIANTGVGPGTYPFATVTVNAQGQLTSAVNNIGTIDDIVSNLATLNDQVAVLQGQVSTLEGDVVAINAALAAIDVTLAAHDVAIAALTADVAAINATLLIIEGEITALEAAVAILQGQIITIFASLSSLDSRVGTLESEVSTLMTQMGIIISQVADLYSRVDTLDAEVATLQSQMAIVQGQIVALFAAIAALRLNTIPANGDVSFYGYKLINLANPVNPTDGVNLQTLTSYVGGLPITLAGFVTGGPAVGGVLTASRGPTCTLDVIPAAANVSIGNFAVYNVAPVANDLYNGYLPGQVINLDWFSSFLNNGII